MRINYSLNNSGEYVIENYNLAKPFSSFLPSIAGLYGKPMWAYYVNRGQCIAAMGINNKDYSILEFVPANKAYRQTTTQGFRTFLKIKRADGGTFCYEPFRPAADADGSDGPDGILQRMYVTSHDFRLEEINRTLGLKIDVLYCTLPGESLSALIRKVKISNLSGQKLEIESLDGLPVIIPYYITNGDLKDMSNLRQAWMGVEHDEEIPFYKIKVLPYDSPEIVFVEGGNFYLNFGVAGNGGIKKSKTIVEPSLVFGAMTDLTYPQGFFSDDFSFPSEQVHVGVTPCGFGYKKMVLDACDSDTAYTLVGNCGSFQKLEDYVQNKLNGKYLEDKIVENKRLIESLKNDIFTSSSSYELDCYCGQTYLDNLLRGGYPVALGDKKQIFYVYSRKHGDLEREYNFFQIDSTYFSQGNSNFRDVNQNRRNDVRFTPRVGTDDLFTFFNLLQLDGFNPLVLAGSRFRIKNFDKLDRVLGKVLNREEVLKVADFVKKGFTPGRLAKFLEDRITSAGAEFLEDRITSAGAEFSNGPETSAGQGSSIGLEAIKKLVGEITDISEKEGLADFKEGYWVDHWIYNTDLLEAYLSVYPDKIVETLFDRCEFTYYDTDETVAPRSQRYVLTAAGVRQLGSVFKSAEKEEKINGRNDYKNLVRTDFGDGEIYRSSLISKIICLIANKAASLDPNGTGIEMEANKPGWCDALNGLPALLGSSINESAELKHLSLLILDIIRRFGVDAEKAVRVPSEVYDLYRAVDELMAEAGPADDAADGVSDYDYWDKSNSAKEDYRSRILYGISGEEKEIKVVELAGFLDRLVKKLGAGLEKAFNPESGVYYTYFINEVTDYELITDREGNPERDGNGYPHVRALAFKQRPIPYFLEGPVHMLAVEKDAQKAGALYASVKRSGLYDEKLRMFKVNENIMDETGEIGRQNVFPRGWLENEAVFLHMEYKFILQLLKCGLYDEYYENFKNCLIPFHDPAVYGRSILENSSFIASSVHPDRKIHGTGFVSRLTGASAEFLSMWQIMTAGKEPFCLDGNGKLCLKIRPALPAWLFTGEAKTVMVCKDNAEREIRLPADTFAFNFLGSTLTILHNRNRKDTFGEGRARMTRIILTRDGKKTEITDGIIREPYSLLVREGKMDRIDIYYV